MREPRPPARPASSPHAPRPKQARTENKAPQTPLPAPFGEDLPSGRREAAGKSRPSAAVTEHFQDRAPARRPRRLEARLPYCLPAGTQLQPRPLPAERRTAVPRALAPPAGTQLLHRAAAGHFPLLGRAPGCSRPAASAAAQAAAPRACRRRPAIQKSTPAARKSRPPLPVQSRAAARAAARGTGSCPPASKILPRPAPVRRTVPRTWRSLPRLRDTRTQPPAQTAAHTPARVPAAHAPIKAPHPQARSRSSLRRARAALRAGSAAPPIPAPDASAAVLLLPFPSRRLLLFLCAVYHPERAETCREMARETPERLRRAAEKRKSVLFACALAFAGKIA